ncbi:glycosyl hydrolases family 31-domain-containing protein [Pelagophyceae sp. CCMP2097]|nr:glycosyl hydrolases family 31-domain-containing protein [Pelagophyceae sp. CCMP2097]
MLWDNPSWSWMNRHDLQALSPLDQGAPGTTFYDVTAAKGGSHWFYFDTAPQKDGYSFGADKQTVHLTVAGGGLTRVILDWDDAANFPAAMAARIDLTAGTNYRVELRTTAANSALSLRRADAELSLTSRVGALIDYYVTWDGTRTMDGAISNGYRFLTGEASLYKRFAFGLWHSRERYHNQSELLDAARTFRKLKIPVDAIVQDWHYWGDLGWGPHWDSALYPDPRGMVSALKVEAIELMVSVWSRFDASTDFFKNMTRDGFMIVPKDVAEDNLYYDAFNPEARAAFYGFSKKAHFDIGVEALWLDATEPEYFPQRHADVFPAAGLDWSPGPQGDALFNAYSLETTRAVSDGLRRDFPTKQGSRVFSLTRSAFAGQQRTGAVLWSGDLSSTWDMLRRQVASSLNYAAAGMPYWSQDVGGFFRPGDQHTSKDYQACLTRWRPPAFQFGAFTPIFRVHGTNGPTELWEFEDETMRVINKTAITLRYRLLPYTYSGFAAVADPKNALTTMQRLLAFDFGDDAAVHGVADEFMFGTAFLVAPIVDNATRRSVYLPEGRWYDFFTPSRSPAGAEDGATTVSVVTKDLWRFPLFVRAGSILPLASGLQHTGMSMARLEVRVYAGADACFELYEDDGRSPAATNAHSTIGFSWADGTKTLTIEKRRGAFAGMEIRRTFDVVLVDGRDDNGGGVDAGTPDASVDYNGGLLTVQL